MRQMNEDGTRMTGDRCERRNRWSVEERVGDRVRTEGGTSGRRREVDGGGIEEVDETDRVGG